MGHSAASATIRASRRPSDPISWAIWSRCAGISRSSKARSHAAILAPTVSTSVPSRSKTTADGADPFSITKPTRMSARNPDRRMLLQPVEHLARMLVTRKDRKEDVLDALAVNDHSQPLVEVLAIRFEDGQAQGLAKTEARIRQQRIRKTEPLRQLALVTRF